MLCWKPMGRSSPSAARSTWHRKPTANAGTRGHHPRTARRPYPSGELRRCPQWHHARPHRASRRDDQRAACRGSDPSSRHRPDRHPIRRCGGRRVSVAYPTRPRRGGPGPADARASILRAHRDGQQRCAHSSGRRRIDSRSRRWVARSRCRRRPDRGSAGNRHRPWSHLISKRGSSRVPTS